MARMRAEEIDHLHAMLRCNDYTGRGYLAASRDVVPEVEALVIYGLAKRGTEDNPGFWVTDRGREILDELGMYE